jgi:LysM repeat protein
MLLAALLLLLSGQVVVADAPHAAPPIHIVQWGENLTWIAARYGVSIRAVMNANGLTNPNRIYAGQRLVIPVGRPGPAPPGTAPARTVYIVRYGDTLSEIAYRYGVSVGALVRVNGLVNPNWICAGQRLIIPGVRPPPRPPSPPAPRPACIWYTVQKGDTLAKIAVRYGVRTWDIVVANHIANPNLIYPLQRLCIPKPCSGAPCAPKPPSGIRPGCEHLAWPREGAKLSGVVKVTGTAKIDNMWYYKLEYRKDGLDEWHYLTGGEEPVVGGLLGEWNTRQVSNGRYTFRLVIVDWTGNYPPPCKVHVTVYNR